MSVGARRTAFSQVLRSEAITKANLFIEHRVDAETMQHIYLNNTQFINEVEVAVYTTDFTMLYHDAAQHDIVKETREMIESISRCGEMDIEVDAGYQAVGILYGGQYVVTAAAYDGYGEANLSSLRRTLLFILFVSIILMLVIGYVLASMTIRPIEKALVSQKMLVSNVSHELRTPLAAIIGGLDLAMQRTRSVDEYQHRISNALSDAHRMSNIIVGLLNMARAEYDQSQIKMESIRIDEMLMEVREDLLRARPNYSIAIAYDDSVAEDDADRNLTVLANHYLLSLAIRNLIENNCKYSDNQTSVITICMKEGHLSLSFSDNGIGMSDMEQKALFTPYFRARRCPAEGHGIGMALAQRIITLHKGHIRVLSKEGHGTTFWVDFL